MNGLPVPIQHRMRFLEAAQIAGEEIQKKIDLPLFKLTSPHGSGEKIVDQTVKLRKHIAGIRVVWQIRGLSHSLRFARSKATEAAIEIT